MSKVKLLFFSQCEDLVKIVFAFKGIMVFSKIFGKLKT